MSCKELIESLRKTAEERTRILWQEAEQEAAACRADIGRKLEQLRKELARRRVVVNGEVSSQALEVARTQARALRLCAEQKLSDRLYQVAVSCLPALRTAAYEDLFRKMAKELPGLAVQTVRVNSADIGIARKHFPGADVAPDGNITGGLDVSAAGGSFRVINTFEKRLERAWNGMLPALISEAYREVLDGVPTVS